MLEEEKERKPESEIQEYGAVEADNGIRVITIIGTIEGHSLEGPSVKTTKYEHLIPLLAQTEQDEKIRGLLMILNTMGGDVEAGLAIAELVRGMKKPSVSLVLGGGHSIGVPLAVCADRSFIARTASMTVHPLRTSGLVINAPETFEYYNKMQERVVRFVCDCSNMEPDRFYELMNSKNQLVNDMGTVLIGKQAVEVGLIDEVGGLAQALAALKQRIGGKKE